MNFIRKPQVSSLMQNYFARNKKQNCHSRISHKRKTTKQNLQQYNKSPQQKETKNRITNQQNL